MTIAIDQLQASGTDGLWQSAGSGPTVLALHSLGLHGGAFAALANQPALQGLRWLAPDMPGHGQQRHLTAFSMEDCVQMAVDVLRHAEVQQLHILGHSMGGAVAALLAARCKQDDSLPKVLSLSLLASPAASVPAFADRGQIALEQGMSVAAADTLARWFGEGDVSPAEVRQFAREALLSMSAQGYDAAWRALAEFPGYATLAPHLPRTLAVAGEQDLSTPPRIMQLIGAAFEQAKRSKDFTLFTLDGGHMFPLVPTPLLAAQLATHWNHNFIEQN